MRRFQFLFWRINDAWLRPGWGSRRLRIGDYRARLKRGRVDGLVFGKTDCVPDEDRCDEHDY
jgi:hypothetical protein